MPHICFNCLPCTDTDFQRQDEGNRHIVAAGLGVTSGVYRKRTVKAPMEPARAANMSDVDVSAWRSSSGSVAVAAFA